MQTCDRIRQVAVYHDGELADQQSAEFAEHVAVCPQCQTELAWLRSLTRQFDLAERPRMPAEALAQLHDRIDQALDPVIRRTTSLLAAIAATVLLACTLQIWALSAHETTPQVSLPSWELVAVSPPTDDPFAAADTDLERLLIEGMLRGNGHE